MEYKFLSPYKCCFLIGIINTPIILIIDFIISFIPCNNNFLCEKKDNEYYKIIGIFNELKIHEYLILIIYTFLMGIFGVLINKTMNDFTIYHLLILFNIEEFIKRIVNPKNFDLIIILILFFIELLMYLIFLEIIELNFCGLSRNIKKNIKERALSDSNLEDNNNRDSFLDDNNDEINNETNNNSYSDDEDNSDINDNSIEKNELVNLIN